MSCCTGFSPDPCSITYILPCFQVTLVYFGKIPTLEIFSTFGKFFHFWNFFPSLYFRFFFFLAFQPIISAILTYWNIVLGIFYIILSYILRIQFTKFLSIILCIFFTLFSSNIGIFWEKI